MPANLDRDVLAYGRRAVGYERGPRGALHREIARRTASIAAGALTGVAAPRILDVGCGTGFLVRHLALLLPEAALVGVDAAAGMVEVAEHDRRGDPRMRFEHATAEQLPHADGAFDLVVSSTSFSHWSDQARGVRECARVLAPGGALVLVDVFTNLGLPPAVFGPGGSGRSLDRASRLIREAGLRPPQWRRAFAGVIRAAVSGRP
ncbi:class I SAM-dependent methyltransferase [Leifsonia poae]|uniref:class I SAM-dependent methyltransferase n=1 Tax=Leifsonia poae TaxID=110933 RepID=UPI001CBFDA17|nr:class I SAM-dependent methyltransferase [Leifsonia poae]